jgi:hypothetical protein
METFDRMWGRWRVTGDEETFQGRLEATREFVVLKMSVSVEGFQKSLEAIEKPFLRMKVTVSVVEGFQTGLETI